MLSSLFSCPCIAPHTDCIDDDDVASFRQPSKESPDCTLHRDLLEATATFRRRAKDLENVNPAALDAALRLVEAFLHGVHAHVSGIHVDAAVTSHADAKNGEAQDLEQPKDLVSITVWFQQGPLLGEIATRSRIPHSVQLGKEVRFIVQRPPSAVEKKAPNGCKEEFSQIPRLILVTQGLSLPQLECHPRLQRLLNDALGKDYSRAAAYDWWIKNKDVEFPLETSKFHRLVESLHGQPLLKGVCPADGLQMSLYGWASAKPVEVEAFEFYVQGRSSDVTLATRVHNLDPTENMELAYNAAKEGLLKHRAIANRFSASSIHFAAAWFGKELNVPLGDANIIIKLFSPAKWWGYGTSGWQRYDETFLLGDKKDSVGRIVEAQGRVLWRMSGKPTSAVSPSVQRKHDGVGNNTCKQKTSASIFFDRTQILLIIVLACVYFVMIQYIVRI